MQVTLAADLLWVGVPHITSPGSRMASRVAASLAAAAAAVCRSDRGRRKVDGGCDRAQRNATGGVFGVSMARGMADVEEIAVSVRADTILH